MAKCPYDLVNHAGKEGSTHDTPRAKSLGVLYMFTAQHTHSTLASTFTCLHVSFYRAATCHSHASACLPCHVFVSSYGTSSLQALVASVTSARLLYFVHCPRPAPAHSSSSARYDTSMFILCTFVVKERSLRSKDNPQRRSGRHFCACLPQHAQHNSARLTAPAGAGTTYRGMQSCPVDYTVRVQGECTAPALEAAIFLPSADARCIQKT